MILEKYLHIYYKTLDEARLQYEAEKTYKELFGNLHEVDVHQFYKAYTALRNSAVCKPGVVNVGGIWHADNKRECVQLNEYGNFKWEKEYDDE